MNLRERKWIVIFSWAKPAVRIEMVAVRKSKLKRSVLFGLLTLWPKIEKHLIKSKKSTKEYLSKVYLEH